MHHRAIWLASFTVLALVVGQAKATTVTTLHFAVNVGPDGAQQCDIIGDLYRPDAAGPSEPVPAVITTHGFGLTKDAQAPVANMLAARGYAVLAYSGLGFGGSTCQIYLDNPQWDGKAASQLVDFMGGKHGIAFLDAAHTQPFAPPDYVVRDSKDLDGVRREYDPRVGFIGVSYGGGLQFAVASIDHRIDAIVPIATWNDLDYSLFPNNTDTAQGVTSYTPGIAKTSWSLFFDAYGVLGAATNFTANPYLPLGCPGWQGTFCIDLVQDALLGYPSPSTSNRLFDSSVFAFGNIVAPTLLIQGMTDTLFNLNQAAATYQMLRSTGTQVAMIWQSGGHSGGPLPGDGNYDAPDPATQYPVSRIMAWFDRYLKGMNINTGPRFAYLRRWMIPGTDAWYAYATANDFPVGTTKRYYLSAAQSMVDTPLAIAIGAQTFVSGPAAIPTSIGPFEAHVGVDYPDINTPGAFAQWTGPVLTAPVNVVGLPTLDLNLIAPLAPLTSGLSPTGMVALYAKIYDVAPDDSQQLIDYQVAPFRVADVGKRVHLNLSGMAYRFDAGHRIRLVVAGGDLNYRGSLISNTVTIASGDFGQVLALPVVQ